MCAGTDNRGVVRMDEDLVRASANRDGSWAPPVPPVEDLACEQEHHGEGDLSKAMDVLAVSVSPS